MKRLIGFLGILVCVGLWAAVPISVADVSGDGAVHAVASSGTAHWIQFIAPTTNTQAVRIGDSAITTARGAKMAPGSGFMLPVNSQQPDYQLSQVFYLVQSGDALSITWGQ